MKKLTKETLQNTCGVVESKENAEFIAKLAELHGVKAMSSIPSDVNSFLILSPGHLYFYKSNISDSFEYEPIKQITIPLPSKSNDDNLAPEESELKYSKRVVDSGCYNLTPEEESELKHKAMVDKANTFLNPEYAEEIWPKVGDEVVFPSGNGVLVISKPDDNGVVIAECNDKDYGRVYKRVTLSILQKPKSPQDLLIEELQTKLCENNYTDNYTLANDIVNGMIDGLVYNGSDK